MRAGAQLEALETVAVQKLMILIDHEKGAL